MTAADETRQMRNAVPGQAGGRRRGGKRRDEFQMVPDAEFTSYYGRPVVKSAPWTHDIPAYLFLGGLAAGSSLLAAGAAATGRDSLRRTGRIGALVAISGSMYALVHDLGKPARFHHMLRVAKPTSPMSVGTWVLTVYGPMVGIAGAAELLPARLRDGVVGKLLRSLATPAGLVAAAVAPAVASYTAVLLADTATPAWHEAHRELPFVFVGSAAAAAGGLGMLGASTGQASPARKLAAGGALLEMLMERRMEASMGLAAQTLHTGKAGRLFAASKALTTVGAVGAATLAGRSRFVAALSGVALLAGSACTRFAVFEAGQESARDPKFTVVPQRERLNAGHSARGEDSHN